MEEQAPKNALKFLRWFCRSDYLDEIEGDLLELYEKQRERSPRRAKWNFRWQVLRHFRPDFVRPFKVFNMVRPALIRHNLLITWRGFLRDKSTFLINLIGLSTGLACVFLIYLWVNDELHVDKFLDKDELLFQVLQTMQGPNGRETIGATPGLLAGGLKEEMPEVQFAVSVIPSTFNVGKGVIAVGDIQVKAAGQYASKDFFQVFSYPLLQGKRDVLLTAKNSVVISEELAGRLFQNPENAMGQTISWQANSIGGPCVVSGVFANPPVNATDRFDLVLIYDWYQENFPDGGWANSSPRSYVLLQGGTRPDRLRSKIKNYLQAKNGNTDAVLMLQRYSDRYLHDRYENGVLAGGRIDYVKLFGLIALLILLIACINFMNLSTAKASVKVKEAGVKKVLGAGRGLLVLQYLSESILAAGLSFIAAVVLVAIMIPQFNELTGKELHLSLLPGLWLPLLGITLFTGVLAGIYPAFFLSGRDGVTMLKGRLKASVGEMWVRKGLILCQFAISLLLIVAVIVVYQQIELIQSGRSLGYDRDHVVYFPVDQPGEAFIEALEQIPEVMSVGGGNLTAGKQLGGTSGIQWEGKSPDDQTFFSAFWMSYGLIETLDMEMLQGRSFSKAFGSPYQVILNEEAVDRMGLKDPVGKTIVVDGDERKIVGIVRDFHFESFYETVKPTVLLLAPMPYAPRLSVKIRAGSEKITISKMKEIYETYHPGLVFDFQFMDEDYQQLYVAENRIAILSRYFASMAIIISCLGLFGLAIFSTDRRKKEIGIRKVLGAGVFGIMKLLTGAFTKIVLLAIAVSLPFSYWLAGHWLERFSLRIDLHWWYFLVPAVLVMLIAWGTVGWQTFRAARLNPVNALKSE